MPVYNQPSGRRAWVTWTTRPRFQPLWIMGVLLLCGCKSVGPRTIRHDRFNYNQEAAQSSKEQLLLNLVRLRYGEPTSWLGIGSMLSQYTFQAGADLTKWDYDINRWANPALRAAFDVRPDPAPTDRWGANLSWSDRPTITYTPLQGEAFAKQLMSPVPTATVLFLAQSGWSIDRVFECCVQQVNGIQNAPIHDVTAANWVSSVRFKTVAALLKKMQDTGHLQYSVERDYGKKATYLVPATGMQETTDEFADLAELLDLPKDRDRIRLIETSVRRNSDELAMQTRSLLGMMFALAQSIDPPAAHVKDGQIKSPFTIGGAGEEDEPDDSWLRVRHSRLPVSDAFAQVYYNGYWFHIAKSDWESKRTFALITYLFALQAKEGPPQVPVVTVPTGG